MSRFLKALLIVFLISVALSPSAARGVRSAEPVTVRVLTMQQAAMTAEEMNSVVTEFTAANPDIKVELEFVSYDALHDKFVTAMASNPPPYDVIMVDTIWYPEFVKAGYLADVTDRIDKKTRDNVFGAAWNVVTVNDKAYGMPWLLDTKYLYYNKAILAKAGFDTPPQTWEELATQAKAIKDKGLVDYPIAWSWAQQEAAICDFALLVAGNNGQTVDKTGKPAFNNPEGITTLDWMVKSIEQGLSNPSSITSVEEDVRNVFSSGRAAFALNWLYMYDLANFNKDESQVVGQVGITRIPVFASGQKSGLKSTSVDGSSGFSVVATSRNKDAAWKYITYLTSEPTQMKYSVHQLPIWTTSYTGDKLKQLQAISPSSPVSVDIFREQFQYAVVRPRIPYYIEGSKALQLALQQALTKQKSPTQALNDAAAIWTKLGSK